MTSLDFHRLRQISRLLPFALFAAVLWLLLRPPMYISSHSSKVCPSDVSTLKVPPDYVFVSLVESSSIASTLAGFSRLHLPRGKTCVIRLKLSSARAIAALSQYNGLCVGRYGQCRTHISLASGARSWADFPLHDVSPVSFVVLVRAGATVTARMITWIRNVHEAVDEFYASGGRRDVAAAAVGCHGEQPLDATWASGRISVNATCALSPVRTLGEDPWRFFVHWHAARRREWNIWPHIWKRDSSMPLFFRARSNNRRDPRLKRIGRMVGLHYEHLDDPHASWEMWYGRWATSYSMRIVTAETALGNAQENDHPEDLVSLGPVWHRPLDAEYGNSYFKALQNIVIRGHSFVSITIVDMSFLEFAKGWLCNVQTAGFLPRNIVWITLDRAVQQALDATGVGFTVDLSEAFMQGGKHEQILYGFPSYWKLMLIRTRLIRDLLNRGIDIFLFEADQIWLQDPFKYFNLEVEAGADMVGTLDTQHNVAGNTLLLRSVPPTRRLWSEVYTRFRRSYDEKGVAHMASRESSFVEHDQHSLSDLLLYNTQFTQDYPVALGLMNSELFVGGSWYVGAYKSKESTRPVIINNNFVSGKKKKKDRAIAFGHWFLDGQGHCIEESVRKALRYEFKMDPLPGRGQIK